VKQHDERRVFRVSAGEHDVEPGDSIARDHSALASFEAFAQSDCVHPHAVHVETHPVVQLSSLFWHFMVQPGLPHPAVQLASVLAQSLKHEPAVSTQLAVHVAPPSPVFS
jgi:hypothetical protein